MDPAVGNAALWQYLNSTERREPVIGLSMMTEYRWPDNHGRNCFCCHCCLDNILSANYMCHLISANHRYNYIKMVFPHLVHDWPVRVHPNGRPRELRDLAQHVERDEGWGTLRVTEMKSSASKSSASQSQKATAKSPLKADGISKTTDVYLRTKGGQKMNIISKSVAELAKLSKSTGATSHFSKPTRPTTTFKPSATPAQEALWDILEAPFVSGDASGTGATTSSATSAICKSTGAMSHLTLTTSSAHVPVSTPPVFKYATTISNCTTSTTASKPSATVCHSATVMPKPTPTFSNTTPFTSKLSKSVATISKSTASMGAVSKATSTSGPGKPATISSATSTISKSTGAMSHLTLTSSKATAHIPVSTPPMFKYTTTIPNCTTSTTASKPSATACHSATVTPKPTATFSNATPDVSKPSSSTTTTTSVFSEVLWESLWEKFEAAVDSSNATGKAVAAGPPVAGACDTSGSPKKKVTSNATETPWKTSTKPEAHTTLTTCQTTKAGSMTGRVQPAGDHASQKRCTPFILPSLATVMSPSSESSPAQTSESTRRFDSKANGPAVGLNFMVRVIYDKRLAIYCQLCEVKVERRNHRFGYRHRSNYVRFMCPALTPKLTSDLSEMELQKIVTDLAKENTAGRTQTVTMNSEREYEELTKAEVPEALAKIQAILRQQRHSVKQQGGPRDSREWQQAPRDPGTKQRDPATRQQDPRLLDPATRQRDPRLLDPATRQQDPAKKQQDPRQRDPGTRQQDPGTRLQDPPSRLQDPGTRLQDPPSRLQDPGTRLQDPGTRQQDPGTRLQDPPPRQQDPGTRLQDPATRQQDPGTRQQDPGTRLQDPGTRLQDPPSRQQDPGTRLQDPGTRQQDPGTRQQDPATRQQDPGTRLQDPGTRLQDPGTRLQDPPSRQQDPGTRLQDPGTRQQDPATRQQDPATRLQDPPSRLQDPGTRLQDPPSRLKDPGTKQQDPATKQQDPATRLQDPGTRLKDPPSRLQDPGTKQQDPATKQQDPGTRLQDPGTRQQDPGTRLQDPGTRLQDPATRLQDPGTRLQDPGTRLQDPATRLQDPGTRLQDPGTRLQDPATRLQDPGTRLQDPGTRQQDPGTRPPTDTQPEGPQSCDVLLECSEDSRTQPVAPKAPKDPGVQPQDPEQRERRSIKVEGTQKPLERPDRRPFLDPDGGHQQPVVHQSNSAGKSRVSYYLTVKLSEAERRRVVGLSSVLEIQCGDITQRLFPFYLCRTCHAVVELRNICGHIISAKHRFNYISKNPDLLAFCNLEVWSEKMEVIKDAIDRVARREQNPTYGLDAEVILLDKNSYHRVQAAPFSEGIHILEDILKQQNLTSSCPPADQPPPDQQSSQDPPHTEESSRPPEADKSRDKEATDIKENVRLKKSLIETTPINLSIVKTEPNPEPLTTLNAHNSNITVTIKQEVKQEDYTHPCFSGHTDMRKAVKRGLDYASSNGDGETFKRRGIEMRKAVKHGLDDGSSNGDGETFKRRRSLTSPDGSATCDGRPGPNLNVSSTAMQCPTPLNQVARVKVETSQCSTSLNQVARVKVETSQCSTSLQQVARVEVETSQCPTSKNQVARGTVEATSAPTTLASPVPHCEPSQMQPRPKLQLVLNSLKKIAFSNVTLESPQTKPVSAASTELSTTPWFVDSSLAKREPIKPVLQSALSGAKRASPPLKLPSATAVPPFLRADKELPPSEPMTSIVNMKKLRVILPKPSGKGVSASQASPENAIEIDATTSTSTQTSIGLVKPRRQWDSIGKILITKPNQSVDPLKWKRVSPKPADDYMSKDNRQLTAESKAADVNDEDQSLESHYRAANPVGEDGPVTSNPQLDCNLGPGVGEPGAATAVNPNTAQALQTSLYNTMASPFNIGVGPYMGSYVTVVNPNPTSQQFTGSDYSVNQPAVPMVSPGGSLPAAGYGPPPVFPYGQVTQNPYFTHGYPFGTGTQNYYVTLGYPYGAGAAQNSYFTHAYPYGSGPVGFPPGLFVQTPPRPQQGTGGQDGMFGGTCTSNPPAEAWPDMQGQQKPQ